MKIKPKFAARERDAFGKLPAMAGLLSILAIAGFLSNAHAQQQMVNVYWTDTPPVLDGKMDDACWQEAEPVVDFKSATTPFQKTAVRFAYDGQNLYVFWTLFEAHLEQVVMGESETKRDQFARQVDGKWVDATELQIYPGRSAMNCLMFISSPRGARYDLASLGTWADYNPDWLSVPGRFDGGPVPPKPSGEGGWTLEQKIPFAELAQVGQGAVTPAVNDEWRIQMYRKKFNPPGFSTWGAGEPPPPDFANFRFSGRKSQAPLPVISRKPSDIFYGDGSLDFTIRGAPTPLAGSCRVIQNGREILKHEAILSQADGTLSIPFRLQDAGEYQFKFELTNKGQIYFSGQEMIQLAPILDLFPQVKDQEISEGKRTVAEDRHPAFAALRQRLDDFDRMNTEVRKQLGRTKKLSADEWRHLAELRQQMINRWPPLRFDINLARLYPGKAGAPPQRFAVGAATESDKIYRDTLYQGSLMEPIRLALAGNEYGSFQLAILPFWDDLKAVSVSCSSLRGPGNITISADNFRWFRVDYVKLDDPPAWLHMKYKHDHEPDPLLPAAPFDVKQGTVGAVWVDVLMPEGTPEGSYTGNVTVTSGGQTVERTLEVRGHGFDIPKHSSLENDFWLAAHNWGRFYGNLRYTPELHARHAAVLGRYRISSFPNDWTFLCDQVPIYVEPDGRFTFDWTTFDRYVQNALTNGTTAFWSALSCNSGWTVYLHNPDTKVIDRASGKTVKLGAYLPPGISNCWDLAKLPYRENRVYREFLQVYVKHLKELGINDCAYYELFDEPRGERFLEMLRHHQYFREVAPELKLFDFSVDPMVKVEGKDAIGLIDVWAPHIDRLNDPEVCKALQERKKKHGEKCWAYTCVEMRLNGLAEGGDMIFNTPHSEDNYTPFCVYHRPYIAVRMNFWMAWYFQLDGFLVYALSSVPTPNLGKRPEERWPTTEWSDGKQMGSGTLVYPGPDFELIPGMRLANIRKGLEDYEYFAVLKSLASKLDAQKNADLLRRVNASLVIDKDIITSIFVWTKDRSRLEAKRSQLAGLIREAEKALGGGKP